eukprot:746087-Hanusia_phi.AAC.7
MTKPEFGHMPQHIPAYLSVESLSNVFIASIAEEDSIFSWNELRDTSTFHLYIVHPLLLTNTKLLSPILFSLNTIVTPGAAQPGSLSDSDRTARWLPDSLEEGGMYGHGDRRTVAGTTRDPAPARP